MAVNMLYATIVEAEEPAPISVIMSQPTSDPTVDITCVSPHGSHGTNDYHVCDFDFGDGSDPVIGRLEGEVMDPYVCWTRILLNSNHYSQM